MRSSGVGLMTFGIMMLGFSVIAGAPSTVEQLFTRNVTFQLAALAAIAGVILFAASEIVVRLPAVVDSSAKARDAQFGRDGGFAAGAMLISVIWIAVLVSSQSKLEDARREAEFEANGEAQNAHLAETSKYVSDPSNMFNSVP